MSLMSMRRKMASKQTATIILWLLIAVFIVGIIMWSVPNNSRGQSDQSYRASGNTVLAVVNGERIDSDYLDKQFFDQLNQSKASPNIDNTLQLREQIVTARLQSIVGAQVMHGFGISDRVLKRKAREMGAEDADNYIAQVKMMAEMQVTQAQAQAKTQQQKANIPTAEQFYRQQIRDAMKEITGKMVENPTDDQFRKALVNYLMDPEKPANANHLDMVRTRLIGQKKTEELTPSPFTEDFAKRITTQKMKVRWIFIAAQGFSATAIEDAMKKAEELHAQLASNPSQFAKVAEKESNHDSHVRGGELGWIGSGDIYQAKLPLMVEYLAFTQPPTDLGPVTQFTVPSQNVSPLASRIGYGFVQVTDGPQDVTPKDFNWAAQKSATMASIRKQYEVGVGQDYLLYMIAKADIECDSPEVASYLATAHGQATATTKLQGEALAKEKDLPSPVVAALSYQVAMGTPDLNTRVRLLTAAVEYADTRVSEVHMLLGDANMGLGKKQEAIDAYENAMIAAASREAEVRQQVRIQYQKMGYTEGVKKIDAWLAENVKQQDTPPAP